MVTADQTFTENAPLSILLAFDDDTAARAAIRLTATLCRKFGSIPTVLRVIELGRYLTPEALPEVANAEELILAADATHEYRNHMLDRVAWLAGAPVDWRAELDVGDDVRCIIRRAETIGAQLIVMGLEHHGTLRRAFVGDTVHQVMASGIAPVLAVTPSLETLPSHVVVGMDFTTSSIRAAHWARRLVRPDGVIDLIFVTPSGSVDRISRDVIAGNPAAPDTDADARFAKLIQELAPAPAMQIKVVRRSGSAADELCDYAQEVGADMIAVGSHRRNLLERIWLGSVSTAVVHDARCSVLMTPPEPA